jgi:ABC-type Na+ efflux pump permease subunit
MRWIPIIVLIALFGAGGAYVVDGVMIAKQKEEQSIPEVHETSIEREEFATIPDKALAALLTKAVEDTSSAIEDITITSSEVRTWPDGCLGLGKDEMCTQATVDGYRVEITAGERLSVYRMSADGGVIRKE